ncbi:MAG: hypothetical protein HRT88_23210 [Lentisphaeraceae bacterium]|nr:hypothetical protein [Lentisphaeraceae bacterium]
MNQEDITYYLSCPTAANEEILKKIIATCEAVDYCGVNQNTFYNGLEGFGKDVRQEFEVKPEEAYELYSEYVHSNIEFLEWQHDELLLGLAEDIEEVSGKMALVVDSIALLTGPHEILAAEDNTIFKSEFSLAFHISKPISEDDAADLNFKARKDKEFNEKLGMMQNICGLQLEGFFGAS